MITRFYVHYFQRLDSNFILLVKDLLMYGMQKMENQQDVSKIVSTVI